MSEKRDCRRNEAPPKNEGKSTSREYINLAVKGDIDGALKDIMTSLGNPNPTQKFI